MSQFLYIDNLTFTYENSIIPLFESVSCQMQTGWTGVVGANGSGKSTLLKLISGQLQPNSGQINFQGATLYCEQRTDFLPEAIEQLIYSTEKIAYKIKNALQIQNDWIERWNTLSHGERKRLQIALALFLQPAVLAIDEPTNHLDVESKRVILNALRNYRGIGLLVSHDRSILDKLCHHTLFVMPPGIDLRACNYSVAAAELERENEFQVQEFIQSKKEVRKLRRRVQQQREKVQRSAKKRSKRNIAPKDHDAKGKVDLARLTGKDGIESRLQQRLQSRLDHAEDLYHSIELKKNSPLGIEFNAAKAAIGFPITIPNQKIHLGENKTLHVPDLAIQFGDKIGIVGENGSGKSTLINHLLKSQPFSKIQVIYIPQEIPLDESREIIQRIQAYQGDEKGQIMSIVSRLGSEPLHLLETTMPTPGEVRKLLLAEGLMLNPGLIVMDEPTNHLDLPSIEHIEKALRECPCAQLLVSHDYVFLKNAVNYYWQFTRKNANEFKIDGSYSV